MTYTGNPDSRASAWQVGITAAAVLAGTAVFTARVVDGLASLPYLMWNSIRVAPPVALAKGFGLYSGPDAGPILNTPYGPVWGLVYTPAALADSPTPALWIALVISLLLFFVPLAWLLWRMAGSIGAVLLGLAAFAVMMPPELARSLFRHHADPPALGFAACAIACLTYRRESRGVLALAAAALFVSLAAWAKQTMAPLALGVLLYVWLADGRRAALRFGSILAVVGIAISGAFLLAFGKPMLFNMFTLQVSHPWQQPLDQAFLKAAETLLRPLIHASAIIAGATYIGWRPLGLRVFAREREWTALVLVSILLSPVAIMGMLHAGGYVNSLSVSTYFMLAAAAVCLAGGADGPNPSSRRTRTVLASLLVLALALPQLVTPVRYTMVRKSIRTLSAWRANSLESATRFARANPGTIYFPDNPLIALFAEGKLHHSIPGIYERRGGGDDTSPVHLRANLPRNMRFVALQSHIPRYALLPSVGQILPEYGKRAVVPELRGWKVWTKGDSPSPRTLK